MFEIGRHTKKRDKKNKKSKILQLHGEIEKLVLIPLLKKELEGN